MISQSYNKNNYYKNTFAVFIEVNPKELPFNDWQYISKSGSSYYYTKKGVYRKSNHWGRAAKCRWILDTGDSIYVSKGRERIGFAKWEGFYKNSESSKSYFIKVDFQKKIVSYDHKSRDKNTGSVYRSAKDSKKIIQKIKRILLSDSWAKYYDFDDLEKLRKKLILELLNS